MNRLFFIFKSRGFKNFFQRVGTVFERFGFTPAKYLNYVQTFCDLTEVLGVRPSFPICANLFRRYPKIKASLEAMPLDLLSHGYTHIDFSDVSKERQCSQLKQSLLVSEEYDISFQGFRAPYLHWNSKTLLALKEMEFSFHSSAVYWRDISSFLRPNDKDAYERAKTFYRPYFSPQSQAIPFYREEGFLEIPVTLPDDEILIERLKITDPKVLSQIWESFLEASHEEGTLFCIQLHPERIFFLQDVLRSLLEKARQKSPSVWMASLKEIADYYLLRLQGHVHLKVLKDGYGIELRFDQDVEVGLFSQGNYSVLDSKNPLYYKKEEALPLIGLSQKASDLKDRLLKLGFLSVISDSKEVHYSIYLNEIKEYDEVCKVLMACQLPLLKLSNWPRGYKSALAVTGDIDSLTVQDFALRFLGG